MHSSSKTFALTLLSLCALGLTAARPASAQNLTYTLSGFIFNDGAIASGFVDFDPTTQTFGDYDITTTSGITDSLTGAHYTPELSSPVKLNPYNIIFQFNTTPIDYNNTYYYSSLNFATMSPATSPGVYPILPGFNLTANGYNDAGEFTPYTNGMNSLPVGFSARIITAGSLIVTPAAVPEASTTASFGLLLMLGGGAVVAACKRKTVG